MREYTEGFPPNDFRARENGFWTGLSFKNGWTGAGPAFCGALELVNTSFYDGKVHWSSLPERFVVGSGKTTIA